MSDRAKGEAFRALAFGPTGPYMLSTILPPSP